MEWERITAGEIEPGDRIARVRTDPPATVAELEAPGVSSRYIKLENGSRIRPRHTAKFWRVVELEGVATAELEAGVPEHEAELTRRAVEEAPPSS